MGSINFFISILKIFVLLGPRVVNSNAFESQLVDTNQLAETERKFPPEFPFGASTAAYQIEGAWNTDGKGPSIWDQYTHDHPERITDRQNCDVGPDSYHLFEEDVKAVKNLSMKIYRFSISWSRVLPDGDISSVNEAGIEYYNKLINIVLEHGIEPVVTMYHYDLPEELQKFGGLTNSIIISYFESYANLLFERFGDRVKRWITFNEPSAFCLQGYGGGSSAPMVQANGIGEYLCANNVLKSHAVAYRLYEKRYADLFNGKVGITLNSLFFYSDTNNTDDVNRAMAFELGWFANPIFSKAGNYPAVMIAQIASNSIREGRDRSRLPVLSEYWTEMIRGSADFLGLNYYSSRNVEQIKATEERDSPSFYGDTKLKYIIKPEWKKSKSSWLYSVPSGVGDLLRWIKEEYSNPEVLITENGWSDDGELDDVGRIEYLRDHLNQILDVVLNDETKLVGYITWSIIDNFEWNAGFTEKFGLFSVNLTSPLKERTPKASATFMRTLITTRQIPAN